jgi:hypothetical protein
VRFITREDGHRAASSEAAPCGEGQINPSGPRVATCATQFKPRTSRLSRFSAGLSLDDYDAHSVRCRRHPRAARGAPIRS